MNFQVPYISFHHKAGLAVLVILLRLIIIVVVIVILIIVVIVILIIRRHPWFSNQGVPGVGTDLLTNATWQSDFNLY